jgi:hypothetical protein
VSLESRLSKLEAQRAGSSRIWVGIDDGPFESYSEELRRMEALSSEEIEARYPGSTLIHVNYVEGIAGAGLDLLTGE